MYSIYFVHIPTKRVKLIWRWCSIVTPDVSGMYFCAQMSPKLVTTGIERWEVGLIAQKNWVRGHLRRMCNSCVCVCTEVFQLLALHLPQSGDQMVEVSQLSVVLEDVSSKPAAVSFGRGVGSPVTPTHLTCSHRHTTTGHTFTLKMFCLSEIKDFMWQLKY